MFIMNCAKRDTLFSKNTERLHPVDVLNVVEPLSHAYVSVDALAHPQRKRPVLTFEQYHRNMRQRLAPRIWPVFVSFH